MAIQNKTAFAILGMLSIAPMSGYDIRQMIKQSTSNFWTESDGQLYPALAALTKEGLIMCKTPLKNNVRHKKIYTITNSGRNALQSWLAEEPEKQSVRSEFMLKIFFGANVEPDVILNHIYSHYYQTKSLLANLETTHTQISEENMDSPHLLNWQLAIDYGAIISEAKLKWCEVAIQKIKKLSNKKIKIKVRKKS